MHTSYSYTAQTQRHSYTDRQTHSHSTATFFKKMIGYGGLNKSSPHRVIYFSVYGVALFKRIKRYGSVGGSMSLGVASELLKAQARPSVSLFLLPVDPNVELSIPVSVPLCLCASCHDDNDLTAQTISQFFPL